MNNIFKMHKRIKIYMLFVFFNILTIFYILTNCLNEESLIKKTEFNINISHEYFKIAMEYYPNWEKYLVTKK